VWNRERKYDQLNKTIQVGDESVIFLHLGDLHLGKRLHEQNLIEDQKYILDQIFDIIQNHNVESVLIAGDVYDKSIPSKEAVNLFDEFLTNLSKMNIAVFIISGNHDSGDRLNFASKILNDNKIYISGIYEGKVPCVMLSDTYGKICVHLLPYVRPASIRQIHHLETDSYIKLIREVLKTLSLDPENRNILVAHEFVTSGGALPERSESECDPIGGIENIDCSLFRDLDYVALGHLHCPQSVGSDNIRYCGSPLKYSFSEARHKKSVTLIEMKEKGNMHIEQIPLKPQHDLREIEGPFLELMSNAEKTEDYIHAVLTDDTCIIDGLDNLRACYPRILKLTYNNIRTREDKIIRPVESIQNKSPAELFAEFYDLMNNTPLTPEQTAVVIKAFDTVDQGEK